MLENIDGYLFVNDVNNTYLISCEREDENLVLPTRDKNYSINAYAFSYLPNLKTVILPSSVNGISNNAFYKCSKLIELTVTKSVTEFPTFDLIFKSSIDINFSSSLALCIPSAATVPSPAILLNGGLKAPSCI